MSPGAENTEAVALFTSTRTVRKWFQEAIETLQASFEATDWDVLCGDDIDSMTDTVTEYINFCATK